MAEQLPLQFEHRGHKSFDTYYPGNNQEVIDHLKNCIAGAGEQQIFIWGAKGLGKSHLLQAASQLAQEQGKTSFYYAFTETELPGTGILIGLDEYEIVCFDNIEIIAGNSEWEHSFFNFYNRHRDHGFRLILSSQCPPNQLPVVLPDLKTRLNWGLTLKLQDLSDNDRVNALAYKARQMGFDISPKIGRFLLKHSTRDLNTLWELLDRLDHATLAAKRKLTVPFLKEILNKQK